jgi:hypothetical protein
MTDIAYVPLMAAFLWSWPDVRGTTSNCMKAISAKRRGEPSTQKQVSLLRTRTKLDACKATRSEKCPFGPLRMIAKARTANHEITARIPDPDEEEDGIYAR